MYYTSVTLFALMQVN